MPRTSPNGAPPAGSLALLYHFCRMQLPAVALTSATVERHLHRTFALYQTKALAKGDKAPDEKVPVPFSATWERYLANLYPLDWFVTVGCLEGDGPAWEHLFAARTGRADCLLIDALRARAVRLYPRNEERQESAVSEFWSHLLVSETPGSVPVLARYDGERPLIPWLIRVFQNWHVSQLRHHPGLSPLPEDDLAHPLEERSSGRWHEAFCLAAREWLRDLSESEMLILGLRLRYRMSQRDVAALLGVHEGTISRQTSQLRDRCLDHISQRLLAQGWTGEDLNDFVLTEMGNLLLDEPRLAGERLAAILGARGKALPRGLAAQG